MFWIQKMLTLIVFFLWFASQGWISKCSRAIEMVDSSADNFKVTFEGFRSYATYIHNFENILRLSQRCSKRIET
jgi:hypothetical protein